MAKWERLGVFRRCGLVVGRIGDYVRQGAVVIQNLKKEKAPGQSRKPITKGAVPGEQLIRT
jgi:hypothetical protein